ncbi:MAG: hypothetical protein K0R12_68 [Gammaproteobacteria bacterium]|jgi:hypothetical protein|nr:hypothetical protein [Gammaproteobacteria bacterium]
MGLSGLRIFTVKTQDFGTLDVAFSEYRTLDRGDSPTAWIEVLRNYRENRENGTNQDSPKIPFPTRGLENSRSWQEFNDTFTWKEDYGRGYLEKFKGSEGQNAERYWFSIKHQT